MVDLLRLIVFDVAANVVIQKASTKRICCGVFNASYIGFSILANYAVFFLEAIWGLKCADEFFAAAICKPFSQALLILCSGSRLFRF